MSGRGRASRAFWSAPIGVVSVCLLAAVVLAGGAALIFSGGGPSTRAATATPAPVRASSSGCSLPAGSQEVSSVELSPPAIVGWHQVGNMEVPEAPATLGPEHRSGGWFYCYQHSPAGALLAAIDVWASGTAASATRVARHLAVNVTPGALGSDELPPGLSLAGYQYVSYTPREAVIEVVFDVYDKGDVEVTTPMVWVPGGADWRLEVPASGSVSSSVIDSSLAGYVAVEVLVIVAANIFSDVGSAVGNVLGGVASSAAAGIITVFAHAVLGSLTRAIEWLATVWINTPTPALADASGNPTGTVAWMQSELLPLTAALAVGSVIVGGAKIAIADAGHGEAREFTKWLFVFVLASTGGVAFAAMLITTCDAFASYIVTQATAGSNFGDHLAQGLGLVTQAVGSHTLEPQGGFLIGLAGTAASAILAIFIGLLALVASFVEFVLMVFRGGVLVILCGLIPLAAAFSNIPTGERWLRRIAGWIVALALYKLAAAFCYAAAFRLSAGTDVIGVMDGLALLIVSVLALPVLLRLTLPAAEHFTLHRGAAASARTAVGAMPTGAITLCDRRRERSGDGGRRGRAAARRRRGWSGSGRFVTGCSGRRQRVGGRVRPWRVRRWRDRREWFWRSRDGGLRGHSRRRWRQGVGRRWRACEIDRGQPAAASPARLRPAFAVPGSAGPPDQDTCERVRTALGRAGGWRAPRRCRRFARGSRRRRARRPPGGSAAPRRSQSGALDEPESNSTNGPDRDGRVGVDANER